MTSKPLTLSLLMATILIRSAQADGPADNLPTQVRPIPPLGIDVPAKDRARLESQLADLTGEIKVLQSRRDARIPRYLPDVEIFARAVEQALTYNELFARPDIQRAELLLEEGLRRARHLLKGETPWTEQKGLVIRGFRSRLDDTVQPYGLVIPPTYRGDIPYRYRTDIWFHGRGEKIVELQFIHQRMTNPGEYQPEDTIVLHPFGRYSNAFKFAGEVDVFEALEHAKANYRIDEDRISVQGFSMGGAAAWHFAVHYADRWFAANPGAGFSETPQFLQTFQGEVLSPTWWEKTLWRWYDCPPCVRNLTHCPVVAYSGEFDRQKQAADVMARAFMLPYGPGRLSHIVGAGMGHRIDTESKAEVERRLNAVDRNDPLQGSGEYWMTYTLRYHKGRWIRINAMDQHWRPATVDASIFSWTADLSIHGASDVSVGLPPGTAADGGKRDAFQISVNSNEIGDVPINSDGSIAFRLYRHQDQWHIGTPPWDGELRKRHGLQGPIDDALMDSFVFVKPSGVCRHELAQEWTTSEFERAVREWRRQMRGDARVKLDVDINEEDIARHNLILWGDPKSNNVLGRIADQLPIQWGESEIVFGERRCDAAHHAPILVYPNPLNPNRYVVLNSSFTYREYDYLNNARQTPKLPDWAIVDLRVPPDNRWPGKIVDADFFNERWEVQPPYRVRMSRSQE